MWVDEWGCEPVSALSSMVTDVRTVDLMCLQCVYNVACAIEQGDLLRLAYLEISCLVENVQWREVAVPPTPILLNCGAWHRPSLLCVLSCYTSNPNILDRESQEFGIFCH